MGVVLVEVGVMSSRLVSMVIALWCVIVIGWASLVVYELSADGGLPPEVAKWFAPGVKKRG